MSHCQQLALQVMIFQKLSKTLIQKLSKTLIQIKPMVMITISIRMVKLCDSSICMSLELIFESCLESGKFTFEWKKANVVPAHKKGDKKILKNCRPTSLLAIARKIFERILYNNMFEFFTKN